MVEGSADFYFVHPIYRQEVYADKQTDSLLRNEHSTDAGVPEDFQPFEETKSPVNFGKPDLQQFPNFEFSGNEQQTLHPGDCVYIPALTWVQVQAAPRFGKNLSNILVNAVYQPSSSLLLALMSAVEHRIIK